MNGQMCEQLRVHVNPISMSRQTGPRTANSAGSFFYNDWEGWGGDESAACPVTATGIAERRGSKRSTAAKSISDGSGVKRESQARTAGRTE